MNNDYKKDKIFNLYTLAELSYQEHFKDMVKDVSLLYPIDWYKNKNYKVKIEIISEAIKTNTLIENTVAYQKIIEGVKFKTKEREI